jgi:hypothetical protein
LCGRRSSSDRWSTAFRHRADERSIHASRPRHRALLRGIDIVNRTDTGNQCRKAGICHSSIFLRSVETAGERKARRTGLPVHHDAKIGTSQFSGDRTNSKSRRIENRIQDIQPLRLNMLI